MLLTISHWVPGADLAAEDGDAVPLDHHRDDRDGLGIEALPKGILQEGRERLKSRGSRLSRSSGR